MSEPEFTNLLVIVAAGFAAPFLLGLVPRLRLPAVVVEILAGIALGPSGFGWVEIDDSVEVIAIIGLAFLLFLAGLEIEFDRLRGRLVRLAAGGFALSFALSMIVAFALGAAGVVETPLLVAIILCATSLGVIIPVLKDAGQVSTRFGQLVLAAGSIADFAAIILLSLLFSGEGGIGSTLILIAGLVLLAFVTLIATRAAEHSGRVSADLLRLQNTTAQIRIRGAIVLLIGFAAAAQALGLEVILGTFIAGAVLTLSDRDEAMTHPDFRPKLNAIGFGFFIPVFFVASGVRFDLDALFAEALDPGHGADLPRGPARGPRGADPALPRLSDQAPGADRRPAPGDLAAVHRRGHGDRLGPRADRPGRERGADRRRPALGHGVSACRSDAASPERGRRRW